MSRSVALVAEDETLLADVMMWALEEAGFDVLLAEHGGAALDVLTRRHVDILVTDIRMPVMDGWALAREARRARPSLPIVFVSGFGGEHAETIERSVFLKKPFDSEELADAVRRML